MGKYIVQLMGGDGVNGSLKGVLMYEDRGVITIKLLYIFYRSRMSTFGCLCISCVILLDDTIKR